MSRPAVSSAAELLRRLGQRGETLAVVESLTGGLLASAFVDVPGASARFRGGLVVYATDLKESLAGVPGPVLAAHGPAAPAVARALAEGGRLRCRADWALATTGVAGPKAQRGLPAGTVFLGLAGPGGLVDDRALRLPGDRASVRRGAVAAALALLADQL